jgi:hypothetical protein
MCFFHGFSGLSLFTVPIMSAYGTLRKARNTHFMGTTAISGAPAEPVSVQETLNWPADFLG